MAFVATTCALQCQNKRLTTQLHKNQAEISQIKPMQLVLVMSSEIWTLMEPLYWYMPCRLLPKYFTLQYFHIFICLFIILLFLSDHVIREEFLYIWESSPWTFSLIIIEQESFTEISTQCVRDADGVLVKTWAVEITHPVYSPEKHLLPVK